MHSNKKLKVVAFGEVLWDVFKDGKKIGGAPLNLALRMQSLGCQAAMVSAVGNDTNGQEIIDYIETKGLNTSGIVKVEEYYTGLVNVSVDNEGIASYEIKYPCAWDKINITETVYELANNSDVLIYGSLSCRDVVSKTSLLKLLDLNAYKVFDVNLRPPHYNIEALLELMQKADFIKFNDEELLEIVLALGFKTTDIEQNIQLILQKTKAEAICVTKGKDGAVLYWNGILYNNGGYKVNVVDTVGAGDSFLATLIMKLLLKEQPQIALNYACAMGALVAASTGANPEISNEQVQRYIQKS